jgi:DNA polymerase-3 subunit epsilon
MSLINSFTAIDFETAQAKRNSICQIGLIRVENGKVIDKKNLLVQPPGNDYYFMNTQIHGINPHMTRSSPTFDQVWFMIEPYIRDQNVFAHNGAFDFSCLRKTLEYYKLNLPEFHSHCTYKLYGKALKPLCVSYGIPLNHHDALSDAMACAHLFMIYLNKKQSL